ncbi:DUF5706 domain-containing protein [Vagococcus lutrae]|uniref:Pycsar system effector family protein n=1 Tax=Vagococcus lutrae TaxID=81947 RepID=UPI00200BD25A|nr:Pycsar system effector family protein [Vagococcus lutrae]UQF70849.1 DUF5706 domain-containing protein [Vagococcus lutrae]
MASSKKDFVYSQNDYLNNYIQFADTKSAVFITVNGVLMGFLYAQFKDILPFEFEKSKHLVLLVSIGLLLVAYVFLFLVIFPRRSYKSGNGIVFWEDVAIYRDAESYKMKVSEIPQDSFEEVMIEQNYYLAKTATKKYKNLHWSFIFSIASYVSVVIFCFLNVLQ